MEWTCECGPNAEASSRRRFPTVNRGSACWCVKEWTERSIRVVSQEKSLLSLRGRRVFVFCSVINHFPMKEVSHEKV